MSSRRIGIAAASILVLAVAIVLGVRALGGSGSSASTASPAPAAVPSTPATDGGSATAATAGPASKGTIPTSGTTSVGNADAVTAACNVSSARLKVLTAIDPGESALESLRDGIPLLDERIGMLQQAVEGRPVLNAVLQHTQALRADWDAALDAHDNGHPAAAKQHVAAANREIARIDKLLTSSAGVPASTCT